MPSPSRKSGMVSVEELSTGGPISKPLAKVLEKLEHQAAGHAVLPEAHEENVNLLVDDLRRKVSGDGHRPMPSGSDTLDERYGLLHPGMLLLEAPHHAGKTALAVQLAQRVREGRPAVPVVYFAYADPVLDIRRRFLTRLARLSHLDYIRGNFEPAAMVKAAERYLKGVGRSLYLVQGTRDLTAEKAETVLLQTLTEHYAALKQETPRDNSCFVVFDHLQAMHSDAEASCGDRDRAVAESLRETARKLRVPMLVLYSGEAGLRDRTVTEAGGVRVVVERKERLLEAADTYAVLRARRDAGDLAERLTAAKRGLRRGDRLPSETGDVRSWDLRFVRNRYGEEGDEELWFVPSTSRWYCPSDLMDGE